MLQKVRQLDSTTLGVGSTRWEVLISIYAASTMCRKKYTNLR